MNKPPIKMFFSKEAFNTFYSMLTFYVASQAQAGETFYSRTAAKMMSQFVNYGNFIAKRNEKDDAFIIHLYESEVMKIIKMYNKYISVHQQPNKDYFADFMANKKSKS